jgi:two-component system chemotaxis response regulator CheY
MKVLIVDDSKVMRMMVGKALMATGLGPEIVEAGDGVEGLTKLDPSIEIILSDWNMPNMNGLEFVKEIRKVNTTVPVIMITTEGSEDKISEAIQAGANGYVCKPFTPEKIKEQIQTVMKK